MQEDSLMFNKPVLRGRELNVECISGSKKLLSMN